VETRHQEETLKGEHLNLITNIILRSIHRSEHQWRSKSASQEERGENEKKLCISVLNAHILWRKAESEIQRNWTLGKVGDKMVVVFAWLRIDIQ